MSTSTITEPTIEPTVATTTATEPVVVNPANQPAKTLDELTAENMRLEKELHSRNKEEAGRRKKLEELEKAELERLQASKTELEKAQERATRAEADKKSLELSLLRRDVAQKVGLPAALVDRLKGETLEELEADANALMESLPKADPAKKPNPNINPTNPAGASQAETVAQQKARLGLTRGFDLFSQSTNEALGGGVLQLGEKGE